LGKKESSEKKVEKHVCNIDWEKEMPPIGEEGEADKMLKDLPSKKDLKRGLTPKLVRGATAVQEVTNLGKPRDESMDGGGGNSSLPDGKILNGKSQRQEKGKGIIRTSHTAEVKRLDVVWMRVSKHYKTKPREGVERKRM